MKVEPLPPERLMEAVDAIYEACVESGSNRLTNLPSRLMGTVEQPQAFCDFTMHEIREAELFLIRCGLLEIRSN